MSREEFWDLWTLHNDIKILNAFALLASMQGASKSRESFYLAYATNILKEQAGKIDLSNISPEWFMDKLLQYSKLASTSKITLV